MKCILCGGESAVFFTDKKTLHAYYRCALCDLRFLEVGGRLPPSEEHARYQSHQNDVHDPRYQEFMSPILNMIRERPAQEVLDFGCGNGPVLRHILEPGGHKVALYDSFFHPDPAPLTRKYDFVAAIEVLEHVYDPAKELALLVSCLKPGGRLGVMTLMVEEGLDFENWYYRRDPTHVCFFSRITFQWIAQRFGFLEPRFHSARVIELQRPNV